MHVTAALLLGLLPTNSSPLSDVATADVAGHALLYGHVALIDADELVASTLFPPNDPEGPNDSGEDEEEPEETPPVPPTV